MPKIKTIKEYKRNYKTFPIGTIVDVTWDLADQLIEKGIAILCKIKKTKKSVAKKVIEKKIEINKEDKNGRSK